MLTKTLDVEFKATGDDDSGTFQAYASVFDVVDSYGDMVVKGAFVDALAAYGTKGDGIPIYWRHRMDDPFLNLGATLEAKEDDHGLWFEGQLELDEAAAARVYKLVKTGRVRQLSFAYDVLEAAWVERKPEDGGSYYELRKLWIHEISIVPVGANQETEFLAVKAARAAAIAAAKTDRQPAVATDPAPVEPVNDPEPADEPTDAKTEEPDGAKAEEPTNVKAARARATNTLIQSIPLGGEGSF